MLTSASKRVTKLLIWISIPSSFVSRNGKLGMFTKYVSTHMSTFPSGSTLPQSHLLAATLAAAYSRAMLGDYIMILMVPQIVIIGIMVFLLFLFFFYI